MRTIVAVAGVWVLGGLLAALAFGHLAHRAAVRSPALERALLELTGVRLTGSSAKRVVASAVAVSIGLLVVVGFGAGTTKPPRPGTASRLLPAERTEPSRKDTHRGDASRPQPERSRTTNRRRQTVAVGTPVDRSSSARPPRFALALRGGVTAGTASVFHMGAVIRHAKFLRARAQAKHMKRDGRAHRHGRAK